MFLPTKKIIWALDAFEEPKELLHNAVRALRLLAQKTGSRVEAVYVMSPAQLNLSVEFNSPWIQQYVPAAEKALEQILRDFDLTDFVEPYVIVQNISSVSHAVDELVKYARENDAGLILTNTHGRTGISRLLLGSFSETMLLRSPIPVMVIGPHSQGVVSLDDILFPSELSHQSTDLFRDVVEMARSLDAKITLFHAIRYPIEPVIQSGVFLLGGGWVPLHTYFSKELDRQQRHAEAWARWAEHQGVRTEVIVSIEAGNVADSILNLARQKNVGFIAMEAQSGAITAALIGSVARQVVRHADCPVWVLRRGAAPAAEQAA